jgi:hypothetical protein
MVVERKKRSMSVLSIDSSSELQIQTQTLVGRSVAVLGITGSGKTNTAAVLIEELLSHGFPLTIVDIEGEYWGLKEKFEILVAGRSRHAELEVGPKSAGKLAEISVKRGIPVILDLSDFTQDESYEFLVQYFKSLWVACSQARHPYQVVLEEAHEWIPQGVSTPLKQLLTRIALRGRKRGLGIILMSQRSAKVEKDVLTQASLLFLHKVVHPVDMRVYKDLIPLPPAQVEDAVRRLQPGEAIVLYNHHISTVRLRLRYTFHAGSTPTLSSASQPKLRKLDEAVLRELRALTASNVEGNLENDERIRLARKVKDLEEAIARKDAEIQRLQSQVDLLSKLSISIEGSLKGFRIPNPQTLEVDQAIVRQVIAGEKGDGTTSVPVATPISVLGQPLQSESSLTPAERRKLDSLIRRVQKLPKLQRSILRLLAEHEGTAMTVPMIATWPSLKESTIRNRPPHDLIRMRLVTRTRSKSGYRYTSSVYSYLQTEFPQVEPDLLVRQMFG